METHSITRPPALLAAVLALLLLVSNADRARRQSFTTDEAFTYNQFVAPPLSAMGQGFDANNHVLNTLLMKAAARVFGVSEWSLRLPALVGGALFLAGLVVLCGGSWAGLLVVAVTALNPMVLDYLSAARGYGLALGMLVWSLYFLLRGWVTWAAVTLALMVSANLAFTIPGVAMAAVYAETRREWKVLLWRFALPGLALAGAILWYPLTAAKSGNFYVGAATLRGMLEGLVGPSFYHSMRHPGPLPEFQYVLTVASLWIVPGLLAAMLFCRATDALGRLVGRTLLVTLALVVAAHLVFGLPYPERRTGLYLIPLFCLAGLTLFRGRLGWVCAVYAGICVGQFATQFGGYFYGEWEFDSATKRLVETMRQRQPARVGVSWQLESTVNFYRQMYGLDWMTPVTRDRPDGSFDCYLLVESDADLAGRYGLRLIERDARSGTQLLER